jgi:hypothetical protein
VLDANGLEGRELELEGTCRLAGNTRAKVTRSRLIQPVYIIKPRIKCSLLHGQSFFSVF